ncbi:hypothetical protein [Lewinella sp. 4G2]|uniref:hypothetical protein n=1 Tax=Lewinella sp. 4G2 TaxID=1803372 RepID=UPI0012FB2AC3|nr:hypothetical protein [Lewinella sp. 4G2]
MTKFSDYGTQADSSLPGILPAGINAQPTGARFEMATKEERAHRAHLEDCKVMEEFAEAAFHFVLNSPDDFSDIF